MDISGKVSTIVAEYIHSNVENSSSVAVLKFTLIVVINFLITAFVVLAICSLTGNLKAGIIALICSPLLRYFSGGFHLKSPNACNIVSASLLIIAVHVQIAFMYTGVSLLIVSVIILFLYAPQGITNLSRIEAKYYPILKFISIGIVASNFYFQSPLLSSVFFLQSLTLLPITQKLVIYYKI